MYLLCAPRVFLVCEYNIDASVLFCVRICCRGAGRVEGGVKRGNGARETEIEYSG